MAGGKIDAIWCRSIDGMETRRFTAVTYDSQKFRNNSNLFENKRRRGLNVDECQSSVQPVLGAVTGGEAPSMSQASIRQTLEMG